MGWDDMKNMVGHYETSSKGCPEPREEFSPLGPSFINMQQHNLTFATFHTKAGITHTKSSDSLTWIMKNDSVTFFC